MKEGGANDKILNEDQNNAFLNFAFILIQVLVSYWKFKALEILRKKLLSCKYDLWIKTMNSVKQIRDWKTNKHSIHHST